MVVVQALLNFTQLTSRVIHGFMQNYHMNETSERTKNQQRKARVEEKMKVKQVKKQASKETIKKNT